MSDNVNHPFYYQQEGRKECIEEILDALGTDGTIHFCIGNVMKYLYRMNEKGSALKNVLKAEWYCNYANKLDTNGDYAGILCKYGMEIAHIKEASE